MDAHSLLQYEDRLLEPGRFDGHLIEGCVPDLTFAQFSDIDLDQLTALGAENLLLDVDGTLLPVYSSTCDPLNEPTAHKLGQMLSDERFKTVNLATENGARPESMLSFLGMSATSRVFQRWEGGDPGESGKVTKGFWRRILFEIDCLETPEKTAIIGNSLTRDIAVPQSLGLKTVLVGTLMRQRRYEWLLYDEQDT